MRTKPRHAQQWFPPQGLPGTPTTQEPLQDASSSTLRTVKTYLSWSFPFGPSLGVHRAQGIDETIKYTFTIQPGMAHLTRLQSPAALEELGGKWGEGPGSLEQYHLNIAPE